MKLRYYLLYAALGLVSLASTAFTSCDRFRNKESAQASADTTRIVCVSKQLTEIMFALGTGNKLVGVDLSSTYPPEAKKLPTVGYHRLLSAEGIISLRPTVVMHDGGIAPEAVVAQMQKVGVPLKQYQGSRTIDETKQLIHMLGTEFGAESKAQELCDKLDTDMKTVEERRKQFAGAPVKVIILHFGRVVNNYLAVGQKSTASKMLEWAGGVNSIDATEGMKPISPELIAQAQPDVILATDFGYDRLGLEKFKDLPGIALTPAAKNNRIYRVEEHDLIYLGPRTGANTLTLMELIHR